jgi:cytochrome b subunit of formate dehydrogenase
MTCGGCHGQALVDFGGSIHGKSHTRGNRDAAICTDCHGWHIIEWAGGRVPPGSARVIPDTCSRCHANETLSRRHGLDTKKIGSYRESFHGIALRYGDTTVANCASCHGYHRILPSSDPASAIHKSNLARTCGICHPGAGDLLAKGSIHVQPSASQDALVFYIRILYIVLIVGMISGLIALIIIDLRSMLRRRSAFSNVNREAAGRTFERLTLNERIQHFVLAGSFMLLVVTGAPVFLYDSWLFHMIISSDALFRLRGGIHKIAALVLVALAIYHLLYIIFSPRGRREALLMIPRVKDFKDFADLVRFNLGFKDAAPRFGRYNLIHKFEYLAVAWGSLVMILTGFMLWLNVQFTVLLPKWTLDTARAVHGYEATLAFLVIVIWHFYNVHLNPEVFPMSRVWIDGKISEEVMKARHPLEYEELTARGP